LDEHVVGAYLAYNSKEENARKETLKHDVGFLYGMNGWGVLESWVGGKQFSSRFKVQGLRFNVCLYRAMTLRKAEAKCSSHESIKII
jgi:hypothetical protein